MGPLRWEINNSFSEEMLSVYSVVYIFYGAIYFNPKQSMILIVLLILNVRSKDFQKGRTLPKILDQIWCIMDYVNDQ